MIILVVFDLTWKVRLFSAKKDFLKQRCAQECNVAILFPASVIWEKGREYWSFYIGWNMQKEDKAFCFTARYFYINYSKQVMLLFHDKHFFSLKKYYLDTIGKLKLGQRLGRYR